MPFDPTGTPKEYQYFIHNILLGCMGKDTAVYHNEIMVHTKKGADHDQEVAKILKNLVKHNLSLNLAKFEFSRSKFR